MNGTSDKPEQGEPSTELKSSEMLTCPENCVFVISFVEKQRVICKPHQPMLFSMGLGRILYLPSNLCPFL